MAQGLDEILLGFVEEMEGYVPLIGDGIAALQADPDNRPVLDEMRRLVHIVRGAAAMLDLAPLSQAARGMELAIEHVREGRAAVSGELLNALQSTAELFARYAEHLRSGGAPDDADLKALVEQICLQIDALPSDALMAARTAPAEPGTEPEAGAADAAALFGAGSLGRMTPAGIELDEELLASFTEEVKEHFDDIGNALYRLESAVTEPLAVSGELGEVLRGIRRSVHTIKGASAVLGLQQIADAGHRIEDVLDWFYESAAQIDPEQVAVLAQALDQLEHLVRRPDAYDAEMLDECLKFLHSQMDRAALRPARAGAPADETTALLDGEGDVFAEDTLGQAAADSLLGDDPADRSLSEGALSLADSAVPGDEGPFLGEAGQDQAPHADALAGALGRMTPAGIELDEELLASFTEEVKEHFDDIGNALYRLESAVTEPLAVSGELGEVLRGIRRSVHTIKGASAVLGLQQIADAGHRIEDVLDWFYESAAQIDPEQVAVLAQALDQLEHLVRRPDAYDAEMLDECLKFLHSQMQSAPGRAPATEPEPATVEPAAAVRPAAGAGGSASTAMFSAEDLQMLREGFMEEAEGHLQELGQSMQALEARVVQTTPVDEALREELRTIRRDVHTIKGASAVIGISEIAEYAHKVEDFLDWLFDKAPAIDPDIVGLLAESADLLGSIVENPASVDTERQQDLYARLAAVSGGAGPAAAEQPAAASSPGAGDEAGAAPEGLDAGEAEGQELSGQELALLRQSFVENADLHQEALHHAVQTLAAAVGQSRLPAESAGEVARMSERIGALRRDALLLGRDDVGDYAGRLVDFLEWLLVSAAPATPLLTDALGDAVDVLGQLMEKPEALDQNRVTGVLGKLADIRSAAAAGKGSAPIRPRPGTAPPAAADAAKTIRIHQTQLDKLINLANELLVGVSGFDRNMALFQSALDELDLTARRLKDIALELETKFEVRALDQLSFHFDRLAEARQAIRDDGDLSEFDAMELDHYTQLNLIIRALNESAIDVTALHTNMEGVHNGLGMDINRQHRVVRELQAQMMRARLSPMSLLTPRLSRTMRDVAARLKKRVRLVMKGDTVELDRMIWEKLADPFMHLMRNSVDHGIETPDERAGTGKPAIATITIAGEREGHHVVVRYSDDGRGIDVNAIREKARESMGDAVDAMDERTLVDLIFRSGFSTQKTVGQISGRGVGMDVVQQNIHDLQGSISVDTQAGQGTLFTIRVPLTLGITRSLLVAIDDVTYGIALNEIRDIHRVERADIAGDGNSFRRDGKTLPLYNLPLLLGRQPGAEEEARPLILTIEADGATAGIRIPRISGQKEVVLKGLGRHLRSVTGIAGAAVMGDGTVIPLLNMAELLAAYHRQAGPEPVRKKERTHALTIMIVDDSISIRRVMSRLVSSNGWIPVEAKDGQAAFEQLDAVRPDCILLDVEMPRMNGFEFLALKANLPEHRSIPVIMLTSRSSEKHRKKALALGASIFLNKPTKDEEFVEAVLKLTGHQRSEQQVRQRRQGEEAL